MLPSHQTLKDESGQAVLSLWSHLTRRCVCVGSDLLQMACFYAATRSCVFKKEALHLQHERCRYSCCEGAFICREKA